MTQRLLVSLGYALYLTVGLGFFGGALSSTPQSGLVALIAFTAGNVFAQVLTRFFSVGASGLTRGQNVLSALFMTVLCVVGIVLRVAPWLLVDQVRLPVLWLLSFGVSVLLTLSANACLSSLPLDDEKGIRWVSYFVPCFGALLALVGFWAVEPVRSVYFSLIPLPAVILCSRANRGQVVSQHEGEPLPERISLSPKVHVMLMAYSASFGFCLAFLPRVTSPWLFSLIAVLLVCLYLLLGQTRFAKLQILPGRLHGFMLPVMVLLLFVLASGDARAAVVAAAAAAVLLLVQTAANMYCLVKDSVVFRLRLGTHISAGRLYPEIGMLAGLVLGSLPALFPPVGSVPVLAPAAALACLSCLGFVVVHSGEEAVHVKEGVIDYRESTPEGMLGDKSRDSNAELRRKCDALGEEHGLTTREGEVFYLLACGYNTSSIAGVLIISGNTVKTHAYRIYRKLGVHSQQELIALIRSS